jgi:hypothetical protein
MGNINAAENIQLLKYFVHFIPKNYRIRDEKIMIERYGDAVFFFFIQKAFQLRLGNPVM